MDFPIIFKRTLYDFNTPNNSTTIFWVYSPGEDPGILKTDQ